MEPVELPVEGLLGSQFGRRRTPGRTIISCCSLACFPRPRPRLPFCNGDADAVGVPVATQDPEPRLATVSHGLRRNEQDVGSAWQPAIALDAHGAALGQGEATRNPSAPAVAEFTYQGSCQGFQFGRPKLPGDRPVGRIIEPIGPHFGVVAGVDLVLGGGLAHGVAIFWPPLVAARGAGAVAALLGPGADAASPCFHGPLCVGLRGSVGSRSPWAAGRASALRRGWLPPGALAPVRGPVCV